MKIKLLILTLTLAIAINCSKESSIQQKPIEYVMPDKNGFWEDNGFYIKYKYVFREFEGKKRLVPIFGGILLPVKYSDLEKLQSNPREYLFGGINIDVKPGEVKKTVFELVDFYSKEFKEENKKPTIIGAEGSSEFIVWYDFNPDGVPFSIMLKFPGTDEAVISDRIEDLEMQESGYIYVSYSIYPFSRSPFYKE